MLLRVLLLGAASLSEKAKALEHAAKAEDIEFVEKGHSDMVDNYIAVASAISKALGLDSKMVEESKTAQTDDSEDGSEVLEFYPEQ